MQAWRRSRIEGRRNSVSCNSELEEPCLPRRPTPIHRQLSRRYTLPWISATRTGAWPALQRWQRLSACGRSRPAHVLGFMLTAAAHVRSRHHAAREMPGRQPASNPRSGLWRCESRLRSLDTSPVAHAPSQRFEQGPRVQALPQRETTERMRPPAREVRPFGFASPFCQEAR